MHAKQPLSMPSIYTLTRHPLIIATRKHQKSLSSSDEDVEVPRHSLTINEQSSMEHCLIVMEKRLKEIKLMLLESKKALDLVWEDIMQRIDDVELDLVKEMKKRFMQRIDDVELDFVKDMKKRFEEIELMLLELKKALYLGREAIIIDEIEPSFSVFNMLEVFSFLGDEGAEVPPHLLTTHEQFSSSYMIWQRLVDTRIDSLEQDGLTRVMEEMERIIGVLDKAITSLEAMEKRLKEIELMQLEVKKAHDLGREDII
ncbi:hypothetical protein CJ030_MR1G022261 [Morella rubra]|uniref:Uncharacterized protein n=1 Tax=Morella rubra TaxID=262757 RepID=A0A6A1WNU0_9ROSI|nr:hypothetical protein CJ030_MR1G022261 [Morella rubra]